MGIDRNAIRKRLSQLQNSTNKNSNLWKPESGKQIVRIVPYKFNNDNPFIELWFHWGLGGKNYLSPKSFGRPDPILEFAIKLRENGDKENYELSRKLFPKLRIYTPIIVRDDSNETPTVKFWGFGKRIYEALLDLIDDDDYGDITDTVNGTDLIIEFKTAEEAGNKYGSITVKPKRKSTKLHDDPKVVESLLTEQSDISELYKELTYDELKDVLESWLSSSTQPETGESDDDNTDTDDNTKNTKDIINETNNKFSELFGEEK